MSEEKIKVKGMLVKYDTPGFGEMKRKPGRPYKSVFTKRTKGLRIRLTEYEYECLKEVSKKKNQSMSDYMRSLLNF